VVVADKLNLLQGILTLNVSLSPVAITGKLHQVLSPSKVLLVELLPALKSEEVAVDVTKLTVPSTSQSPAVNEILVTVLEGEIYQSLPLFL